jgi:DNA-binding GntR family transcriptional regulator
MATPRQERYVTRSLLGDDIVERNPANRKKASGTLTDRITVDLRRRIISGDLPGGSRIIVDDLRAKYKASHIPIREAIRRLESEGLLVHPPNVGTYVAPLSRTEADELYDVRLIIEPTVAARAIQVRTDEDVRAARRAFQALSRVDSATDPVRFQYAHNAFHWSLLRPGASPTIERVLIPIWRAVERYTIFVYSHPDVPSVGAAHHKILMQLWAAGDESIADFSIRHLQSMRDGFADQLHGIPEDAQVFPGSRTTTDLLSHHDPD